MNISLQDVIEQLVASPNIVSRQPIYETYDKNVQGNTAHERGAAACAVTTCFRDFPELDKQHGDIGVSLGVGGNPFIAKVCAKQAAIDGITQAYVQTACVGSRPLGATDCLNFGNPEKEDQMADLVAGIDGIKEVCTKYEIPIVSGNVSLYNEASGQSIPPSAGVAVFGRVDDVTKVRPIGFQKEGDSVFVVGSRSTNLGASALLRTLNQEDTRIPETDYESVKDLVQNLQAMVDQELASSVSQIRFGGSIIAALVSAFKGNTGLQIDLEQESDVLKLLSEDVGAVISTSNPDAIRTLFGDSAWEIGTVTSGDFVVTIDGKELVNTKIDQLKGSWDNGLRDIL